MKYKAIIFDVDGTLAETEELHRTAFNKAFEKCNLDWFWDEEIYEELLSVTGGKERLAYYQDRNLPKNKILSDNEIKHLHEKKTTIYGSTILKTKFNLRPGVAKVIERAKIKNIKIAIATASSLTNVETLAKSVWGTSINNIFNVVVTGNEVKKKKPSPEVYHLALKKLCIQSKHCLAIEDSLPGLRSAKGAGLRTVITPSSYTKNDNFSLADTVLTSLVDFEI